MSSTPKLRPTLAALISVGIASLTHISTAEALSVPEARHLLARTGFGNASWTEIQRLLPLSRKQAVEHLLKSTKQKTTLPPPGWALSAPTFRPPRGAAREERRAFFRVRRQEALTLIDWWVREMAATSSPLTERMTLFWHNHFTTSYRKVRAPHLLYRQNLTLRRYALDNFRVLTHAMAQDAAMVIFLDNFRNRRGKPNENFARELLELFTLGEGRYTERDVKEAARSFTGWAIDRNTGAFRFFSRRHDNGLKKFMGRRGRFNGDQIIEIVLKRPQVAVHITQKAWRAFVSESPNAGEVKIIAGRFRRSGYDIKALMRGLLLSRSFWLAKNRGRLIKSPLDLIVGTVRQFGVSPPSGRMLFRLTRALGQVPFMPPNVKGWPGGKRWITANTLLMRRQVLRALLRRPAAVRNRKTKMGKMVKPGMAQQMMRGRMQPLDLDRWVRRGPSAYRNAQRVTQILLAIPPVQAPRAGTDPSRYVRALLLDPAYQLK